MAECEVKYEGRRYKERFYLIPNVEIFKYGKLWGIELAWFVFSFVVVAYKKHRKGVEEDG